MAVAGSFPLARERLPFRSLAERTRRVMLCAMQSINVAGVIHRENSPKVDREKAKVIIHRHIETLSKCWLRRERRGAGWTNAASNPISMIW